MNKGVKLAASILLGCSLFCSNVLAAESNIWQQVAQEQMIDVNSNLLPRGIEIARNINIETRGRYIASSGVSITNEGYGVLGVYADTLAHVAVKKIKMTIYIDQWDEEREDWSQVDSKSVTYEYEEGGETLNEVSESFLVENLETEKYYRLRGLHAVWSFDGYIETQATITNGILLTNGPA